MSAAANTSAAVRDDRRARLAVGVVVHADALPRVVLDDDLVAVRHQLAHAARHEADAIFEDLDLFRDADAHGNFSGEVGGSKWSTRDARPTGAWACRIPVAKV